MRQHIALWIAIAVLTTALLFSGCKTADGNLSVSDEQTVWQYLDEAGDVQAYLEETDLDVCEILRLITTHSLCVDNRSANSLNCSDEASTYSTVFWETLKAAEYEEKLTGLYKSNNLSIESVTLIWNQCSINFSRSECKVDIDSIFQFITASDQYISATGIELNVNYAEHRIYYCEKTEIGWRITNIEKSAIYPI